MSRHPWDWVCRAGLLAGVLGLPLLLGGCGGGTQQVDGLVVFPPGEPARELQGYMVAFESTEQPVSAVGVIQGDGTFQVGTHSTRDGAILGKHRVNIFAPGSTDASLSNSPILPKYARFETSGLEVTIVRGRNKVTLEVERNPRARAGSQPRLPPGHPDARLSPEERRRDFGK